MEVRANIKTLSDAVAKATVGHREDDKRKKQAEIRLAGAYSELEAAMKELAALTTESNGSLEQSLAAVSKLQVYQKDEQAKTRKARE